MNSSIKDLRKRFPQIAFMDKKGEVYLDSAATSLKLDLVLEAFKEFYETGVSNVHRGDHHLSLQATEKYEEARASVAAFLGAEHSSEIIFTRGATESLNLLAESLSPFLKPDDEILVSEMEHHSNFLPWRGLANKLNLKFKAAPVDPEGALNLDSFKELLNPKTKIVSLAHISNATGVINPLDKIIPWVRKTEAFMIVDAAQSAPCLPIDVKQMDCDFLVFSGHKIFSPSGIGVLYGRHRHLKNMPPYQKGGGTIFKVSMGGEDWADPPHRFEAGTPFIEGALALSKVLNFFRKEIDISSLIKWENQLVKQAEESLSTLPEIRLIGHKNNRSNILSFTAEGINSSDLSFALTQQKLALRAGSHCCMPLMDKLGLNSGTVRASFSVYNREEDAAALKKGLEKALKLLRNS